MENLPTLIGAGPTWVSLDRADPHERGAKARVRFSIGALADEFEGVVVYPASIAKDLESLSRGTISEAQLTTQDTELVLDLKRVAEAVVEVSASIRRYKPEYHLYFQYGVELSNLSGIASSLRKNFC
jgi:hypothetical protein